jgi:hypothetical protein
VRGLAGSPLIDCSRWLSWSHDQPVLGLQGGESLLSELLEALLDRLASCDEAQLLEVFEDLRGAIRGDDVVDDEAVGDRVQHLADRGLDPDL